MSARDFHPEEPIAALASPWGESALAVIRISGPGSLGLLGRLFVASGSGSLERAAGHTLLHGFFCEPPAAGAPDGVPAAARERIDEVLIGVFRSPRSFTGEDSADIFTHGSPVIIRRVLETLRGAGFRFAGPGEFTLRAFLNGKMDLTQAEAVNELVRARTDRARALALSRLGGSIESGIRTVKQGLLEMLAALEVRIDYPDEDLEGPPVDERRLSSSLTELERLLGTYAIGRTFQEGISVVLAGATNSGKSTLFNRLLREERAIVSEIHGTTRDYLEAAVSLEGIPVRLYDTAGYRQARDELEREGMRRTDEVVRSAQIVLYLVDASRGVMPEDGEFLERGGSQVIPVWSKADLAGGVGELSGLPGCPEGFAAVSALTGMGIGELARRVAERALGGLGAADADGPIIDSLRQKELLEQAVAALGQLRRGVGERQPLDLLAVDLKEALDALGEITGEVSTQEILNTVFSRFCVGK